MAVYLADLNGYEAMNEAYGAQFLSTLPARVCVEGSRLPDDVDVEIDTIAYPGDA